jgi:hypothetical protein
MSTMSGRQEAFGREGAEFAEQWTKKPTCFQRRIIMKSEQTQPVAQELEAAGLEIWKQLAMSSKWIHSPHCTPLAYVDNYPFPVLLETRDLIARKIK